MADPQQGGGQQPEAPTTPEQLAKALFQDPRGTLRTIQQNAQAAADTASSDYMMEVQVAAIEELKSILSPESE